MKANGHCTQQKAYQTRHIYQIVPDVKAPSHDQLAPLEILTDDEVLDWKKKDGQRERERVAKLTCHR